jgi:2-polyprenyl-3-methyl-5-hydroxy-6-metoxy-1,4-benzoquinol methylase
LNTSGTGLHRRPQLTKANAMKYNHKFVERLAIGTVDHNTIILPNLRATLGNVRDKRILDIGCGSGRYSRFFARSGAQVTAIDKSQQQLQKAFAIEREERLGISYRQCDVAKASLGADFDIALLMFVIIDLDNPTRITEFVSAAWRALKIGGVLVIADLHPHNMNRANGFEDFVGKDGKGYFDNGAEALSKTWLANGTRIVFDPNYHYRLDFILNTLANNQFCLTKFLEPNYRVEFPTHMLIFARKRSGSDGEHNWNAKEYMEPQVV